MADHAHTGLDVEVERTAPCLAKVSFTVSAEEFEKTRAAGLRNIARRTRMKGFRPGKAPLQVLERQFGAEVQRDVVQHFLNHAYDKAMKDNELRPAAHPRIDVDAIQAPAKGEPLKHEFEVMLRPDIELGEVRGLKAQRKKIEVGEEEIQAALAELRREHSRLEPAGEDGLTADGMAVAKFSFFLEGEDEPVLERDGLRLSPKTPPKGVDAEAFEKALTGATAGAEASFELVFPEDFPEERAREQKGRIAVALTEVFRIVEPTDEELASAISKPDDEELEPFVQRRIREAREQAEEHRIETELLDGLIEAHPIDVPGPLVESQVESRLQEMRTTLEGQGLSAEEIETKVAEERGSIATSSTRALRAIYLMEEIAKQEDLLVREEDLAEEMKRIAGRNGVPIDEVRKYYREEGLVQQLAIELLERKVRSFLLESADISEA